MPRRHGGIAKAGKVKDQTPIIPKADSARRVTGRARLRSKVNQRLHVSLNWRPNKQPIGAAGGVL